MNAQQILAQARDAMTVQRVFGEPIVQDGVTLIPVAKVGGGGGGGGGTGPTGADGSPQSSGEGVGFGLGVTPAGVYVIKGDQVSWQPALDVNRVILGGQIVVVVLLLTLRTIIRAKRET